MNYTNVLTRLINTPLLIDASKLEVLTSEISIKLLTGQMLDRSQSTPVQEEVNTQIPNVAIIPIHGSLVNKNGVGASGSTSYETIKQQTIQALQMGIPNIGFDISSGGGEASGAFPLADFINSIPSKYGANTFAFTDSQANSSAYAIAAATQTIYATDTADVGSIGAVMSLVDVTKADAADGISYTILRSKADKASYNPHEPMNDKVISKANEALAVWDTKFNTSMVKYRPNLSMDTITALAGNTVNAVKGLELGLIDQIVNSIEDIYPMLQENTLNNSPSQPKIGNTMALELQEALGQLVEAKSQLESLQASTNLAVQTAVQNERSRVLKVLEAKTTFGVTDANVVNAISKGWSLDMVTDVFTELKATKDELATINTSTSSLGSQTPEQIASLAARQAAGQEDSFENSLLTGLKDMGSVTNLFAGMR